MSSLLINNNEMAFILYGCKMDLETRFAHFRAKNDVSPL